MQRFGRSFAVRYRQGLQQQKGEGFRNSDAEVKKAGPLIDIRRTHMRVIVRIQTGISPNISPILGRSRPGSLSRSQRPSRRINHPLYPYHCFYVVEPRRVQEE